MNYICVCGKEFDNSQAFNGRESHCEIHQQIKHGSLDNLKKHQDAFRNAGCQASVKRMKKKKEQKTAKEDSWKNQEHVCGVCGKIITTSYGSGRFCSSFLRS